MTDLSDLIARVEAASGPDRELDAAIILFEINSISEDERKRRALAAAGSRAEQSTPVPAVTASIDATVALKNRVLPGASVYLNHFAVATEPTLVWHTKAVVNEHYVGGAERKDDQIALALVAAVLKAVQAQREAA